MVSSFNPPQARCFHHISCSSWGHGYFSSGIRLKMKHVVYLAVSLFRSLGVSNVFFRVFLSLKDNVRFMMYGTGGG